MSDERRRSTYRIEAPHFVASVEFERRSMRSVLTIGAAPIVKYMLGWESVRVARYCREKGWKIERVASPEKTQLEPRP